MLSCLLNAVVILDTESLNLFSTELCCVRLLLVLVIAPPPPLPPPKTLFAPVFCTAFVILVFVIDGDVMLVVPEFADCDRGITLTSSGPDSPAVKFVALLTTDGPNPLAA